MSQVQFLKKASGFSVITFLFFCITFTGIYFFLKYSSYYLEHRTVKYVFENINFSLLDKSSLEIKSIIQKRFQVNSVENLDVSKDVIVKRYKDYIEIKVDYAVQEKLFYNIDLIFYFNEVYRYDI